MTASPHLQPRSPRRHLRSVSSIQSRRPKPAKRSQPRRSKPEHPAAASPHSTQTLPIRRRRRRPSYTGLASETLVKLSVNGILSAAALMTLMTLFPYYWAQHAKLQEVTRQVQAIEAEVATLKEDFNRSFDPSQAPSVMRDQSGLLAPNQRRVVLTNQDPNQSKPPNTEQE